MMVYYIYIGLNVIKKTLIFFVKKKNKKSRTKKNILTTTHVALSFITVWADCDAVALAVYIQVAFLLFFIFLLFDLLYVNVDGGVSFSSLSVIRSQ